MSRAHRCDRCGELFQSDQGCVALDVSVADKLEPDEKEDDRKWSNWTEVDFCPKCSTALLDLIAPALLGLVRPK